MNAAEHIVEAYYRLVEGCFTIADRKVSKGNNMQLDFLAYNLQNDIQYHIEVSVTHMPGWWETLAQHKQKFEKKFFGIPTKQKQPKNYFKQILETYQSVGFNPSKVKRVYVEWVIKESVDSTRMNHYIINPIDNVEYEITIISMRNLILPELAKTIRTSNYDDEILRTFSLLIQQEKQTKSSLISFVTKKS